MQENYQLVQPKRHRESDRGEARHLLCSEPLQPRDFRIAQAVLSEIQDRVSAFIELSRNTLMQRNHLNGTRYELSRAL